MDDPNITMEEYIRLEEEKARRRGKVYNWETATYGKIWDNEDVHDLGSVETEFPAIVFNDTLTSEAALSCEPTNDDIPPWGNIRRKAEGVEGLEWVVRSKFEFKLSRFMLEKNLHAKGLEEMSWTTTRNPPYPTPPSLTTVDNTERTIEEERPEGEETTTTPGKKTPQSPTLYHPSKSSSVPFPSRLKKQKKDDDDERLLSIFRQIHINLPFLEAMIHMTKGAKVLKDLLSHKEKLEKAASLVKLSEECSIVIQRSLPQKEGDLASFTLPCLIVPLAVKNALADLGASINLMPHSLFLRLGISERKPTSMSIQLANRSVKYPIGVCENLLVKINKFISPVNFVVLEMDEGELVL
ncbi:reverse transcriptase domain-containing protein [Tanacetum coccineum]|uniref:Reverse transcriptase domain-containing protein n=1 Tax=Tanacetum coccineum TaxID=301880 RepID=A0ABQ5CMS2_9ASTR